MPIAIFHTLQIGQMFWLRGEQCRKTSATTYVNLTNAAMGEYYYAPTDEVKLTPTSVDIPQELLKKKIIDIFNRQRIPLPLLGPNGMKDLLALYQPPAVLQVALKPGTAPKRVVKKAIAKKAAKKSVTKKGK